LGMASILTVGKALATGLSVVSSFASASASKNEGERQAQIAEQQEDIATASGQRRAAEQYRRARLIQSRQKAIAAASGGGADVSVINLMGEVDREADLNARTEVFNAATQANAAGERADAARASGRNQFTAGVLGGIGAGISGASSMYENFGKQATAKPQVKSRYG